MLTVGSRARHGGPRRAVNVCLVFATTGSMSDKIDDLARCMVDFAGELARLRLDWQLAEPAVLQAAP